MALKIEFETGNAAFRLEADDPDVEGTHNVAAVAEAVRRVADQVERGAREDEGVVMDEYGNKVGRWWLTDD